MEDELKEIEYREMVRDFYKIYNPLREKYGLRSHMYFSIRGEALIEIWEYKGERCGRCICRITEKDGIPCYRKAIQQLEHYRKEREGEGHGQNTAMAV